MRIYRSKQPTGEDGGSISSRVSNLLVAISIVRNSYSTSRMAGERQPCNVTTTRAILLGGVADLILTLATNPFNGSDLTTFSRATSLSFAHSPPPYYCPDHKNVLQLHK